MYHYYQLVLGPIRCGVAWGRKIVYTYYHLEASDFLKIMLRTLC